MYTLCWIEESNNTRERKWIGFQNREGINNFIKKNKITDYRITIDIQQYESLNRSYDELKQKLKSLKNYIGEAIGE